VAGAAVLEIGGGAGSAAEKALERLSLRIERYHFTELVPTFLRRGERAARAAAAGSATRVETGKLDMTRPWAEQGIEAATYDAVYSVNCFHVAPDLEEVLRQALAALRPGGWLVLSECVKPRDPFRAIYVDFIFEFLASFTKVSTHPEKRPVHGFLSPAAWRASLGSAGFGTVEVIPDVEELAEKFPNFFVAAVAAQKPLG
jgi:SAM-dependent methyltransferase